jgi:hypothetical protein
MRVWVLTWEPDHGNSDVLAVAGSLELAKAAAEGHASKPLNWQRGEYEDVVIWSAMPYTGDLAGYEIAEHEVIAA